MAQPHHAHAVRTHPIRLAESESIAVDLCPCGTLQLHLGALTLRFNGVGLARLLRTLGVALVRAREAGIDAEEPMPADMTWRRAHGDA
jgi:hypothetical protein